MRESKHFINGEYLDSPDSPPLANYSPVTGQQIGIIHNGGEQEVDLAVSAARNALEGEWGQLSVNQRIELLYKVADRINERFDEFLEAECADTGKPYSLASHIDIPRGAANFKVFADTVKNVPNEAFEMATPDGGSALNYSQRVPKGVIAVICPWNLPLLLMTWKVAPALACGNTVVVKPSNETTLSTCLLGEVMNEVGIPKGVFNVVVGKGSRTGDALVRHPGVDAITFTGSTATGEGLMETAAKGVRDISLELGGKNAGVVFADADLDKAVEGTLRSAFANCGQVCLGTERVYVERPIFDEFVQRMTAGAESFTFGKPEDSATTMGPLISKTHRDKVLGYFAKAREEGANVVTGGGVPELPDALKDGFWVQPTIWTGLPEDAVVVREEIFGPCCHIAPFDSEQEVVRLANDTPYGLAAALWTENASRAHRVAGKLDAGIVWVNSWFLRDLRTAFGGMKQSGIGREGGVHSLEFYTELKNICLKL
ncbi:2-hydroxymuconic semialdehyde dehydrogenase [Marinobacterium arenosum]|uniref:2-hydroxymuconic semialdehyde dehydrogenase n=1 Tax=Marinobacterium arenosum TaxID=2862496 RepID=UPI001C978FF5|nr:2-hydroxymuconic semialdehyde dehydrogenase [Marinobacterium arenosum]MBY4676680.1 2-hydroxymuconic semialdehyde dehydrogenase [Marinobacterium arenosum]